MKKAVILLSGGLDSTTVLAIAKKMKFKLYALSFSYGQKHKIELKFAKKVAKIFKVSDHKVAKIDLSIFAGSALTSFLEVPKNKEFKNFLESKEIPITYVPARNTIFLSYALAYAETIGATDIFIGANALDYSGYPDCRPKFINAFEKMANLATVASTTKNLKIKIQAPLINMSKKEIIKTGINLGIDYSKTHSCYDPIIEKNLIKSCGLCDSCKIRIEGFKEAMIFDKIKYQT